MTRARLAAALIAFGIALRLCFLGADSFWVDEAYSVTHVLRHPAGEIWRTSVDPNHPPLFFVVLRTALRLGGTSETMARLPSALTSVCSLGLLFVLARRLGFTREAATTAVVLLALSPVDIWYAQEARMYAMVAATAILFAIALTIDSWIGLVLTGVVLAVGLYVDFTMVPLSLALISLWTVRWWHIDRRTERLALMVVAITAAWILFKPRWTHLKEVIDRIDTVPLFVRVRETFGIHLAAGTAAILVVVLLAIAVGVAAAVIWRSTENPRVRVGWAWTVWTTFVLCTAALIVPRAYSIKQFLATGWPFVVLLVAWSLVDLPRGRTTGATERMRLPVAIAVSVIAAVVTVATPRADWRGAVAYLNGRQPRPDAVWMDPPWNAYPYEYYRPSIASLPSPVITSPAAGSAATARNVCLVADRFGKRPPTSATEAWLDQHAKVVDAIQLTRLEVRCYSKTN